MTKPWILFSTFLLLTLSSCDLRQDKHDTETAEERNSKPEPQSIFLEPEFDEIIMVPLRLRASEYAKELVRLQLAEAALPPAEKEADHLKAYALQRQILRMELGLLEVQQAVAQRIVERRNFRSDITQEERDINQTQLSWLRAKMGETESRYEKAKKVYENEKAMRQQESQNAEVK